MEAKFRELIAQNEELMAVLKQKGAAQSDEWGARETILRLQEQLHVALEAKKRSDDKIEELISSIAPLRDALENERTRVLELENRIKISGSASPTKDSDGRSMREQMLEQQLAEARAWGAKKESQCEKLLRKHASCRCGEGESRHVSNRDLDASAAIRAERDELKWREEKMLDSPSMKEYPRQNFLGNIFHGNEGSPFTSETFEDRRIGERSPFSGNNSTLQILAGHGESPSPYSPESRLGQLVSLIIKDENN